MYLIKDILDKLVLVMSTKRNREKKGRDGHYILRLVCLAFDSGDDGVGMGFLGKAAKRRLVCEHIVAFISTCCIASCRASRVAPSRCIVYDRIWTACMRHWLFLPSRTHAGIIRTYTNLFGIRGVSEAILPGIRPP